MAPLDPITTDLLACLCPESPGQAHLNQRAITAWLALYQRATAHQITPLLYHQLKNAADIQAPEVIIQRCQQDYQHNAYQNVCFYQALVEVSRQLHQANIPLILLKGSHLSKYVYRNLAIRHMTDMDVLIQPNDLAAVEKILLGMGYVLMNPEAREWYYHHHYHLVYRSPQQLYLEVHWHIQEPKISTIDIQSCWQQAQTVELDGIPVWLFQPEHLFLHLCAHLAQNSFQLNLKHLYDIAFMVEDAEHPLSWPRLIACAAQWQLQKSVYVSLYLARTLLAAPVPDTVLAAVQPSGVTPPMLEVAVQSILNTQPDPWQKAAKFYTELFLRPQPPTGVLSSSQHTGGHRYRRYAYQSRLLLRQMFKYSRLIWQQRQQSVGIPLRQRLQKLYHYARFNHWLKVAHIRK